MLDPWSLVLLKARLCVTLKLQMLVSGFPKPVMLLLNVAVVALVTLAELKSE
jgi:hypothetical protein